MNENIIVPGVNGRMKAPDGSTHHNRLRWWSVALGSVAIVFTGVVLSVTDAEAIPAFARKYDMECSHCHSMVPRLNPVGTFFHDNLSFKGIGNRLPESLEANVRSEDPEDLHPAYWPVSFRVEGGYQFDRADNQLTDISGSTTQLATVTTNTFVLTQLELMAGGLITPGISFYLTYFPEAINIGLPGQPPLHQHPGAEAGVGQTGAVGYAWVRFADIFGQMDDSDDHADADEHGHDHAAEDQPPAEHAHHHGFDVLFGAHELELAVSGHERLTNAPYEIYRYNPQGHQTEFTLDSPQLGLEIDAGTPWFGYAISVYNGPSSSADDNRIPDVFGHLTFERGDDRWGFFTVYGTTPTENVSATSVPGTGNDNKPYMRIGTDNSLYFGPMNLLLTYLYGQDDADLFANPVSNPFGSPVQDAKFHGGFIEADYMIESVRTMLMARYDRIRNIQQGITTIDKDRNNLDAFTIALRRDLALTSRMNLQLHIEANSTISHGVTAPGQEVQTLTDDTRVIANTIYAGLDFAF